MDLSKAIIFVVGNLDEAYSMSRDMNPDISADEFYKATSKINIADVKTALAERFRPEQIARLGNNHVIYRSFKNEHFVALIQRELKRIGDFVFEEFGWQIEFTKSVERIVYAEGVFPVQGTRPVFTTVKNLIESRISNLVVTVLESGLDVDRMVWRYKGEKFIYQLVDDNGRVVKTLSDKAKLKVENLRKSVDPEIQASIAVHEAAHAVVAALTLRLIPSVVVTRTASGNEGFCYVNFPKGPMTKQSLRKDIMITLAGYVAEKMIFGDDLTSSGVYSDIQSASTLANKAVRKYAMGSDPIHIAVESMSKDNAFMLEDRHSTEAIQIIRDCETDVKNLLLRNKLLLLKMAEYLTLNSRMEASMIETYVRRYTCEAWVQTEGFISESEYYQFKTMLSSALQELQRSSAHDEIERLMSAQSLPDQEEKMEVANIE